MPIQTPTATVFATSELLETILLKLDLRYLLLAQAVCKSWKQAIDESPAIQQKLFFKPITTDAEPYFNPLLQEILPAFFQLDSINCAMEYLSSHFIQMYLGERQDAILRKRATWRRMLPVQPPAKITIVQQTHYCGCGSASTDFPQLTKEFHRLQANGARMGLIYDIAIQRLDKDSGSQFFVEWHMFLPNTPKDSLTMWEDWVKSQSEEDPDEEEYPYEPQPERVDRNDLRKWEVEQARVRDFRPENRITIRGMSNYCYEPDKRATGLQVRDRGVELMVFESEKPPPKNGRGRKK